MERGVQFKVIILYVGLFLLFGYSFIACADKKHVHKTSMDMSQIQTLWREQDSLLKEIDSLRGGVNWDSIIHQRKIDSLEIISEFDKTTR